MTTTAAWELETEELAGYRVLRTVARSRRARVALGWSAEETAPVALKVIPDADPDASASALREVAAIERAQGEHVVRLRDLGSSPAGLCLVLDWLPGGTLADLLARRPRVAGGEVVTVLAPIAAALERMHAAGVAHGRIAAEAVAFRDDGAPVLVGFGAAEVFPAGLPEAGLEAQPGVRADRAGMRALALDLLARVVPIGPLVVGRVDPAPGAAERDAARLSTELATRPDAEVIPWCAREVFSLAEATPVGLRGGVEGAAEAREPRGRVVPPSTPVPPDADLPAGGTPPAAPRALSRIAELAAPVLEAGPVAIVRTRLRARWAALGRMLVGGAVVAVALGVGLGTPVVGTPPPAPVPVETLRSAPVPEEAGPIVEEGPLADDPVAAAALLLAARDGCLRDLSLLCLEDVDQSGSAALEADRALVRDAIAGGELPASALALPGSGEPRLVERLGASAIVELPGEKGAAAEGAAAESGETRPASLLLVQGEAGWRIREYLPAGAG